MRAGFLATLAVAAVLAGCSGTPEQPETKAPQWGPGGTADVAPVVGAPAPNVPAVPIDTKADGVPYGTAAAIPADRSTPAQQAEAAAAASAAGLPVTRQQRGTWACDNGETIELRFFPDQGIAVLVRGGQNVELQQESVPTGFKFSNGQTSITGNGDAVTLNVGMMAGTACKPA
jgi:membrane-bound inhibitor of C-type lysozyme